MAKWRYGVILDAGSSGTRVYVYRWHNPTWARKHASKDDLRSLPVLKTKKKWTLKTNPGVSTFGTKPESVGSDHLKPLLDHALKYIPKDQVKETPLFLLATAGMRLLPQVQREQVLANICSFAKEYSDFQIPDCNLHIQVIPGETEGLYGWIAANYLLQGFDRPEEHNHGKGHHTYGFLDMGGASAQIAFVPNATEIAKHGNDLKLLRLRKVDGSVEEYQVFTTTWLGFGANQARTRYVDALKHATGSQAKELPDPCLPTGLKLTTTGQPYTSSSTGPYLLGTGRFSECLRQTHPLLGKDQPCKDEPCLLGGIHVPSIDFDVNHFVGVSEYWHTTHYVFDMNHKDKAYDFSTYQSRVSEFCSTSWQEIAADVKKHKWGDKVDETTAEEVCFKASWLINMLHDGIGIPRVGLEHIGDGKNVTKSLIDSARNTGFTDPFKAVNKISDVEVSWTLGKMVLYASSEIPPSSDEAYPVGFGSNIPGTPVPQDFQLPSGAKGSMLDSTEDLLDNLFLDSPRRIPGFLIFLLIIIVAVFLLCGRDRRKSAVNRVCSFCGLGKRRKSSSGGSPSRFGKLFGLSQTYERVDGGEAGDGGFELAAYDSDEDIGGGRSGWATPKLMVDGMTDGGSPGKRGLDSGFLVRADSRDNLGAGLEARINRSRSPAVRSGLGKHAAD